MNVGVLEAAQSVLLLYVHLTAFCIAYLFRGYSGRTFPSGVDKTCSSCGN